MTDDSPATFRATFSLPAELAVEISEVARALGVSQSALVTEVLSGPLGKLAMYVAMGAPAPANTPLRRRGESHALVRRLVHDALVQAAAADPDLFS